MSKTRGDALGCHVKRLRRFHSAARGYRPELESCCEAPGFAYRMLRTPASRSVVSGSGVGPGVSSLGDS